MHTYVALLRCIGPTNPNMKSDKLKMVFESLGFKNVKTVIASGNVVFQTKSANTKMLESKIEKALPQKLGFTTTIIVRSKEELLKLVAKEPFRDIKDEKPNYLIVTFFKDRKEELCTVVDLGTDGKTPAFMSEVERKYGKQITTRTWKTVGRILKAMNTITPLPAYR